MPRIDVDVHLPIPAIDALYPHLPEYWIEHVTNTLFKGPNQFYHPPKSKIARRPSRERPEKVVGLSLEALRSELLDPEETEIAVTSCLSAVDSVHNPDAAAAVASAVNDWQRVEWLERDDRLRGSIVVPIQQPSLAIAEVERLADDPAFVQVLLPVRTEHPLGSRLYHPLWETLERLELVAALHFGGSPVMPPTPTGWPSYFLEDYVAMAQVFATQLTSLVVEGVFSAYPRTRVVMLESGFTWLPAHLWRMDKEWRNLRRLVPWVKQRPSEYVREHVRVGIQPLDPPPTVKQMLEIVDQLECEELLVYTSDFPHRHSSDPQEALLNHLPEALRSRIEDRNARKFYGF